MIETDDYTPPERVFKGEYRHEHGVTVITMSGRKIIMESRFRNALRLRITQPGACVDKTVTERLGLLSDDRDETEFDYSLVDGVIRFSNGKLGLTFDMNTNEFAFFSAAAGGGRPKESPRAASSRSAGPRTPYFDRANATESIFCVLQIVYDLRP